MDNVSETEVKSKRLLSELKFLPGDQAQIYDEYLATQDFLYENKGEVVHLLNVVRAEKKMFNTYTKKAKEYALKAFSEKPNEKTLFFYVSSRIANKTSDKIDFIINDIFKNVKGKSLSDLRLIFEAGLCNKSGNYLEANKKISKFKDIYLGNVFWQSEFLVDDFFLGSQETTFLGNLIEVNDGRDKLEETVYAISVSCELTYFERYAQWFLKSVERTTDVPVTVYLSIINFDVEYARSKIDAWLNKESKVRVVLVSFEVSSEKLIPASAVCRLVCLSEILLFQNKPVVFCEIDSIIVKNLKSIVYEGVENKSDQLLRVIGHILPWQMFTCGFGVFYPTTSGKKAAKLVESFCKGIYNNYEKLMWADQAVLEGAIRFSSLVDGRYKTYSPPLGHISKHIFTPTGSTHKKIEKIECRFNEINIKKELA